MGFAATSGGMGREGAPAIFDPRSASCRRVRGWGMVRREILHKASLQKQGVPLKHSSPQEGRIRGVCSGPF
jgi:hypothetical protein